MLLLVSFALLFVLSLFLRAHTYTHIFSSELFEAKLWTWGKCGRWWGTGKPGVLQSMGLQGVGHDWATEQQQHCVHHSLFSSVQFSRSVVSDSLLPHELQHARPPCPSPTPGAHSNSRPSIELVMPSSQWNIIQSLKNEALIWATTWMNLKNIMLSERS